MPVVPFAIVLLLGIFLYPLSFFILGKTFGEVIFYRGIIHAFLIFGIQILLGVSILTRTGSLARISDAASRRFASVGLAALALSFNLTFLIVFPVTFDRSVTTYLLEELAHKKSLSIEEMQSLMIEDYVVRNNAVLRRMREQELSGNVVSQGDRYILTPQGRQFIGLSRAVRRLFSIPPHSEAFLAPPIGSKE